MISDLAFELAGTIHHDGHGGVADDLTSPAALTAWVRDRAALFNDRAALLGDRAGDRPDGSLTDRAEGWAGDFDADEASHRAVLGLRAAIRSLFGYAVSPTPPSRADAGRLLPLDEALRRVNGAASAVPVTLELEWESTETEPLARTVTAPSTPEAALTGALARAAIAFLTGPHRANLRACSAPRCVRYFVREHGRQEFCKASCGNRARAARHYQRHHPAQP
ncbi:ABATE domain-containing protein [Actinoplanes sp. NEAU-A12]|uniref:ABATE domain-containing protein n=1 Tax=Actinoplanes sandaracinus TaxID=3045177 RepID=A0ABT6WKP3_9ACTN|nr:ABATE domain-containing protein [Actinoplanes sandaracinus]MDI6100301.1 ABATE domain-containing protein [Actinoplanes sandaracinus]